MKRWGGTWSTVVGVFAALALTACGQPTAVGDPAKQPVSAEEGQVDEKVLVYTTLYPLQYVAERIGGEYAEVKNIVPPGVEPHDFEPTARDIVALSEAQVFVYNGSGFELWVEKAVEGIDRTKTIVVNATEGLPLLTVSEEGDHHDHGAEDAHAEASHAEESHADGEHHEAEHAAEAEHNHDHGAEDAHTEEAHAEESHAAEEHPEDQHAAESEHNHDHDHGPNDPHVWLDPTLLKQQAEKIKDALIKADQAHQEEYQRQYEALAADLDALDQEYQAVAAKAKQKEFVVSHSAFGYLAHRYGLTQTSISGLSPADEPSAAELKELVEHVKENQVEYILFETLASPKVAEVIARETGAQTATLNPLEGLTEAEQQEGKDYLSVMRENLQTLRKALGVDE
ncbi:zinc ABC transporter substrate-binding protein [Brevibacillus humidisoli]|uniref:metal ABC transporter solute-binding protein, Zn/Mn family n=1 Tax=Brevibacillus humidisoli TaxID=2895522 RepID=UPI001E40912F|nr:zinc ABC transporter substrate-binding protein [Brevibacillus humidisoli]UFJ40563.1 zinc ABC transporter substrate-binding protein [Brevibacillus humidisoli]